MQKREYCRLMSAACRHASCSDWATSHGQQSSNTNRNWTARHVPSKSNSQRTAGHSFQQREGLSGAFPAHLKLDDMTSAPEVTLSRLHTDRHGQHRNQGHWFYYWTICGVRHRCRFHMFSSDFKRDQKELWA